MDPQFYKVLHLIGVMFLFIGLGALFLIGKNGDGRKPAVIFHGIGLLFLLVSGFGLLAKASLKVEGGVMVKLVIWLVMGAMIVVAKKGLLKGYVGWLVIVVLGGIAAYLGGQLPSPW